MRIGLFSDTYLPDINGVATSVETLRKALESHGHHVFVIANHKGLLNLIREDNILRLPGLELKWLYGYAMSSPIQLKAAEEIKSMNLDLIHVHTEFGVGMFGRLFAKEYNIPLVSTYHTMYEDYTHYVNAFDLKVIDKSAKYLVENFSKLMNRQAQIVISPSQKTKETLIAYGIKSPISIIPTGIDLNKFNPQNIDDEKVKTIKEKYGIQEDDHLCIYLGRIAEEKAIDLLIKGFVKCAKTSPKYKLMIVGGGPDLEKLKELTKELQIQNNVIFTGPQDREYVPAFYKCADCFASFSTSETQGMTFIEAMATSLPIFVRKDDVLLDLVDEKENGYYVNEESFSDTLMNFYQLSDEKLQQMKENAKNKVKRYDTEVFYKDIITCYEEAIHSYHTTYTVSKVKTSADTVTVTFTRKDEEVKCLMSVEDYFAYKLNKNKIVYELILEEIKKKEFVLKAWNLCIRKISIKDRTRKEIYDILLKENTLEVFQINRLIDQLEEKGYINDRLYLKNALEKMNESNEGKQKIIRKLLKKGIPYDMIMNEMNNNNDDEEKVKATKIIEKIENTIHHGSALMKKQWMISKLVNKGFSLDIAKNAVFEYEFSEEFFQVENSLEKDLEKLVKTTSRKYQGKECKNKVIQKLIQKGYKKEEILEKIEERGLFDEN